MKILLATDGSTHSKAAVEEVARRPFPPNTIVRIISAYERIALIAAMSPMGVSQEYSAEADLQALKAAENAAENAQKVLYNKNPALTTTTIVIEGSPKSVILKEAETFHADLIVVGSHGLGVVERFLLGSVSQAVALHAKCSVEIVRR
ncbi:MAG: universal stress protein [Ferruginibacter sp.]|nr:universal stress protein [Ferruginibacter sp.]